MSGVQQRQVESDEDGMRLDRWFAHHFPQLGFGRLQKLIRNNCPLLILVDLSIRAVWEILELLQRERDGCGYPVIALVDDETECLLDRAYETGVRTYLRRPFTFAEFIERARLMRLQFRLQKLPEF